MIGRHLHNGLRALRVKAGLQQRELAEHAGISRQTLGALESGDTVPATSIALQLARALGCRVEDMFWLEPDDGPLEVTWAGRHDDLAGRQRVAVADVDGRWVAHPLDGDSAVAFAVPADGILTTTKRDTAKTAPRVRPLREAEALRQNLFAAGCDPAMALLAGHLEEGRRGGRLHWLERGSAAALDLVAERHAHVAGVHLFDEDSGEHNVAPVRRRLGGRPMILVNLAVWEQGLVVLTGNPKKIRTVADLARKTVRVVGRETGSGAQELFNRLAAYEGVPRKTLEVVSVARGHREVARAVASGIADVGIATKAAAACHALAFIPLAEARFDLVFPKDAAEDPRLGRMLDALHSPRFKRDLGGIVGYGTSRTGHIVTEVAA